MGQQVLYIANGRMGLLTEGTATELGSERLKKYVETMRSLQKQREWKSSGQGARFMGESNPLGYFREEDVDARIEGIAQSGGGLVYTIHVDGTNGMYRKELQDQDAPEGVLFSDPRYHLLDIAVKGDRVAASIAMGAERHIGLLSLSHAGCAVVTDGDTMEETPCWSPDRNLVYFSTAGFGRDENRVVCGMGPRSIASYDLDSHELEELAADGQYNFIRPKAGENGDLYFIRYPYRINQAEKGNLLADIALAPVRIAKAVGGWLNLFSQRYGGESLRSGGSAKAKQKSDKELFIAGNLINVEQTRKENAERGETYPGIAPANWELLRRTSGGAISCLKKGVLSFDLAPGGGVVYSNGEHIIFLSPSGKETLLGKVPLVTHLVAVDPSLIPAEEHLL